MRTAAGNPGVAAPAGRPRPPPRANRRQHPCFSIFQLRPPLTRGVSAPLTTSTRTQTDATGPAYGHGTWNRAASGRPRPGCRPGAALSAAVGHPGDSTGFRRASLDDRAHCGRCGTGSRLCAAIRPGGRPPRVSRWQRSASAPGRQLVLSPLVGHRACVGGSRVCLRVRQRQGSRRGPHPAGAPPLGPSNYSSKAG
jgi:hypothetical protein